MPPRPVANAVVTFGLVSIPVRLYTAISPQAFSFNMLHPKCKSRIRQRYECPTCNEPVVRNDLVKGYEFAKDQYVTFTDDELKRLEQAASPAIEILEFVPLETVDPLHYEHAQYLGPDKGGDKPYRLLVEALRRSGRAAIARTVSRGKEHMVLIRPVADGLVIHALYHGDEVRSLADVPKGDVATARPEEIDLALKLVDHLATQAFDPAKYHDTYRAKLEALIADKVKGEEIAAVPAAEPRAQIIDLMDALKKSLAASKPGAAAAATTDEAAPAAEEAPVAAPKKARRAKAG